MFVTDSSTLLSLILCPKFLTVCWGLIWTGNSWVQVVELQGLSEPGSTYTGTMPKSKFVCISVAFVHCPYPVVTLKSVANPLTWLQASE